MAINRSSSKAPALATIFNTATAEYTTVDESLADSPNAVLFDKGRYSSSWNAPWYGTNYGEWVIVPHQDFEAQVKIWGAGGGAHGSTGGAAGGGGFAKARVEFYQGIPYSITVGEGGFYAHHNYDGNGSRYAYRTNTTFGNGGGGGITVVLEEECLDYSSSQGQPMAAQPQELEPTQAHFGEQGKQPPY